jgi:hypothetical protein
MVTKPFGERKINLVPPIAMRCMLQARDAWAGRRRENSAPAEQLVQAKQLGLPITPARTLGGSRHVHAPGR